MGANRLTIGNVVPHLVVAGGHTWGPGGVMEEGSGHTRSPAVCGHRVGVGLLPWCLFRSVPSPALEQMNNFEAEFHVMMMHV